MNVLAVVVAEFWAVLNEMAPYLLFGFLVAGLLSLVLSPDAISRHLGGTGLRTILRAAFWGVPMPLCSCSVIPVAVSLRRHGAGRGATTAFLLSTPQTGVDSVLVTYSLLGPLFAIFRPLAAFATGLLGGALVEAFGGSSHEASGAAVCEADTCCFRAVGMRRLLSALRYGFVTLPRDIARELIVGLLIAGALAVWLPEDLFAETLPPGFRQMLVMTALGIPIYVCATASVPIAAALMAKGVTPGAAFAFLVAGPATNAATLLTLRKLLGTRVAVIYLLTIICAAWGGGFLLDRLFVLTGLPHAHNGHSLLSDSVKSGASLVLLAVLGYALLKGPPKGEPCHT